MKYFKDEISKDDKTASSLLSLNILYGEMMDSLFSDIEIDPRDFIVKSKKLQTKFLSIRQANKPISKMVNAKFTNRKITNDDSKR